MTQPRILIIAGPNGAGKTTFANEFLPNEAQCPRFVNADLIAAGLSPYAPDQAARLAGKLMLEQIRSFVAKGESFAFETTLSGRAYALHIPRWQALGFAVKLFFLRLPDADFAVRRVALRVRLGGHDVPEATIRRRFGKGWRNFQQLYRPLVDEWSLYDNSGDMPRLIEDGGKHA
jgi:predicted ABC-type ATPase